MKLKKFAFSSLMLAFSTFANAQLFEATGVGETAEKARQNAVTNAIKLSVGEFVVNKEELKNDQFNQTVVSHSNAYVDKVEQLSQKQLAENEFEVKVAVDIKSQKLIDTLKEMQVDVLENATDNNELLSELTKLKTNQKATQDWEQLVDELLIKPIKENKEIVSVKIAGKLKPISSDPDKDTVKLGLPLMIEVSKEYEKSIKRILEQAKAGIDKSKEHCFIREINISKRSHPSEYIRYCLPWDKIDILNKVFSKEFREFINGVGDRYWSKLEIKLLDENKSVFKNIEPKMYVEELDLENIKKDPFRVSDRVNVYNLLPKFLFTGTDSGWLFASGKVKVYAIFDLTSQEISELKDIQVIFYNTSN